MANASRCLSTLRLSDRATHFCGYGLGYFAVARFVRVYDVGQQFFALVHTPGRKLSECLTGGSHSLIDFLDRAIGDLANDFGRRRIDNIVDRAGGGRPLAVDVILRAVIHCLFPGFTGRKCYWFDWFSTTA